MKLIPKRLFFWTAILMVFTMTSLNVLPAAAGLTASRHSGTTSIESVRDADMVAAQRALENKVVAQKLKDYGVAPEEVQLKLVSMSDQDLHTLATATKGLPSGGDGTGAIIGVLVVIILVIVVLRLMNREVVVR